MRNHPLVNVLGYTYLYNFHVIWLLNLLTLCRLLFDDSTPKVFINFYLKSFKFDFIITPFKLNYFV